MRIPALTFSLSLIRDRRGVSAVEFAMVAPIMIAFYFGMVEFCQGFMADKRMAHSTSAVADLVSQADSMTRQELDDIFQVGALIMQPFPINNLRQRITSVTMIANNRYKVDWSRGRGLSPRTAPPPIPPGLLEEGQTIIVSEGEYDYDSPIDYLMPGLTEFTHTYYLRPRLVDQIPYTP